MSFEIRYSDLAGRIGKLHTMHGVLETPAFIPVVHPVRQTISAQFLKSLGFEAVITNAYITLRHYGDEARKRGIHDIINYDGVVMTDSGGYQVLEYGSVEVKPEDMAEFERDIRSDIPVPLDKPTGYGLDYEMAKEYVEITLKNAKETMRIAQASNIDQIWAAPVQGAEHSDLVTYSAGALDEMGFKLMALGSPVELMEAYEFAALSVMIATAKRAIPSKPIHLFGAGHPLTIPLAIALGCDTFDSASYMLYAKDGRYMHPNGTVRLEDLSYLPCSCEVCVKFKAKELVEMDRDKMTIEVAKHNLYVLRAEVEAVKQAIMDGRLWEYVIQKARAHPKLMEAVALLKDFEFLGEGTPLFKERAIFLFDPVDQYRPEAKRFREMADGFRTEKKMLILHPDTEVHPFYSTRSYNEMVKRFPEAQICSYSKFLGVIPAEISDIFPAAHNLTRSGDQKAVDYPTFVESLKKFVTSNGFNDVRIVADDFMRQAIEAAGIRANVVDASKLAIEKL